MLSIFPLFLEAPAPQSSFYPFYAPSCDVRADDGNVFLCPCNILQEAFLECELVVDHIAAADGIPLVGGYAVPNACVALEALVVHLFQHGGLSMGVMGSFCDSIANSASLAPIQVCRAGRKGMPSQQYTRSLTFSDSQSSHPHRHWLPDQRTCGTAPSGNHP